MISLLTLETEDCVCSLQWWCKFPGGVRGAARGVKDPVSAASTETQEKSERADSGTLALDSRDKYLWLDTSKGDANDAVVDPCCITPLLSVTFIGWSLTSTNVRVLSARSIPLLHLWEHHSSDYFWRGWHSLFLIFVWGSIWSSQEEFLLWFLKISLWCKINIVNIWCLGTWCMLGLRWAQKWWLHIDVTWTGDICNCICCASKKRSKVTTSCLFNTLQEVLSFPG